MKTEAHDAGALQYQKNPQSYAVFLDSAAAERSHRVAPGAVARVEA